jgi:pimeloyl-ACP methyl ester carboxylesterase
VDLRLNDRIVYYANGGIAYDAGKRSLVFVHGAGMDHTVWTLYTRYFARNGYNVFAFDLPGHGRSEGAALESIEAMAKWLLAALGALGITQATLAGHSMGSLIALHAAAASSGLAHNLALLGFSHPMQVGRPLLEAARNNDHAAIDMMMIWGHDHLAQIGGNAMAGMGIVTPAQRIVERAAPGVLFADLNACHTYAGGEASAQALDCPVTLILAERDRMTPVRSARAFLKYFRHAESIVLSECGHGMLAERPEETYRALAQALEA